jgi:hypothetical protein
VLREDFARGIIDFPHFHDPAFPLIKHPAASLYAPPEYPPEDDMSAILHDPPPQAIHNGHSLPGQPLHQRAQDPNRWSSSYSASAPRSRSSSIGNSYHDVSPPLLSQKQSYDLSWQTVDEKDEIPGSEEETDDEQTLDNLDDDSDPNDDPEPTSAVIVAEQGRGLIVDAESVPIFQLQIPPGRSPLSLLSSFH